MDDQKHPADRKCAGPGIILTIAETDRKLAIRRVVIHQICLLGLFWASALGCTLPTRIRIQNPAARAEKHAAASTPIAKVAPAGSTYPVQPVGYEQHDKADGSGQESSSDPAESLPIPSAAATDDLDSLIAQALACHPKIAAARQRAAALSHRIPQVTALDDPVISNTFWSIQNQALQTAGGRVAHQFGIQQKVPWPEKIAARGTLAKREAQVAAAEIAKAEREVIESVRLAYYELWLSDRLIAVVNDNKTLVDDLITVSEARYQSGGSQQDVLRAELEGDTLSDHLISLRRQKEQARSDLGTLVRQPVHLMPTAYAEISLPESVPQLEQLISQAEI
ncbi:MAG: TolC family protein, partial [Planctomycetota bacterium]